MKRAPDTDRLPDYIQRGGEIVFSPPGVAKGVRMYAFMLRADPERLTRMFNCYLNEPSGGVARIVPVGSTIVLNVVELKHVGALTPPDNVRGYFREIEMAIPGGFRITPAMRAAVKSIPGVVDVHDV